MKIGLAADINDKKGKASIPVNAIALPIQIALMKMVGNALISLINRPMSKRNSTAKKGENDAVF
ncbi:MAG: hypothetical protein WCF54_13125 [Terracidiphilus sp.]